MESICVGTDLAKFSEKRSSYLRNGIGSDSRLKHMIRGISDGLHENEKSCEPDNTLAAWMDRLSSTD